MEKWNTVLYYWETYYPGIIAIIACAMMFVFNVSVCDVPNLKELVPVIVSVGAIIIGFLATMVSVLVVALHTRVMRRISKFHGMPLLIRYFREALFSGFAVTVLSILFFPFIGKEEIYCWYLFVFWVTVNVFFIVCSFRVVKTMLSIFTKMVTEKDEED